jgi:CyaY protein
MDEKEFERLSDAALIAIDLSLEVCGIDVDVSATAGGVLEITFADDSKMIINRHSAAREIWVAAKSGGFHFRFVGGVWRDTRNGEPLSAALARLLSQQSGDEVDAAMLDLS